jgi:hydrogenase maturation protease
VVPPLLVIAIGNPSRGDDALGPALLELLAADGVAADGQVELLTDFQLQVEHALDLAGRCAVLFVDAAWPTAAGAGSGAAGVTLTPITADAAAPLSSHALRPQAVLQVCETLAPPAPPAWLLAIGGEGFELGAAMSDIACRHLETARGEVHRWLAARKRTAGVDVAAAAA